MSRDPRAFLWDVSTASQDIVAFTQAMSVAEYVSNKLIQAAVERKFEVIGEALNQLPSPIQTWRPVFRTSR